MKVVRFIFRFAFSLLIAVVLVILGLYLTGNSHLAKAVRSTYLVGKTGPTIDDYPKFENREIKPSKVQRWKQASNYSSYELEGDLLAKVEEMETVALLVIQDNELVFEKYWNGYSENSKTNSFSMAKSFTSLCVGAAIKEGKIESVEQKISDFLPKYEGTEITIEDLLTMSSGIDFGESYGDPFGFMSKTYYGTDLYDLTLSKESKVAPGTEWKYQGGNTLLLSFIVEKATGKSLSKYFEEEFWQPMGAEENALWTLNEQDGIEKAYCCFYSNARDYARVGQLMLDSGKWMNQQLIDRSYFINSIKPVNLPKEGGENVDYYGYQWWISEFNNTPIHYARGIQGQYIISIPEWDAVVVRLGHKRHPEKGAAEPKDIFTYLKVAKEVIQ